jgi:hypothetical protein
MKILLVAAELFLVDGRTGGKTDTTKLVVALRSSVLDQRAKIAA